MRRVNIADSSRLASLGSHSFRAARSCSTLRFHTASSRLEATFSRNQNLINTSRASAANFCTRVNARLLAPQWQSEGVRRYLQGFREGQRRVRRLVRWGLATRSSAEKTKQQSEKVHLQQMHVLTTRRKCMRSPETGTYVEACEVIPPSRKVGASEAAQFGLRNQLSWLIIRWLCCSGHC